MPPKRRGETSGAEPTKRRRWTPDEENELRTLVGELGPDKWPAVAQRLGTGRSADAVEQHWRITPRASAPSAPREEASAAAPKPAKRARKSAAKRAARSAAKPAATLAGDSLAALPPGASGAAKRAPPAAKKPQSKPAPRPPRAAPTPAAAPEEPAAKKPRPAPTVDEPPATATEDLAVGARVALGGAPGVLTAIEERGWYKVRLDGEETVRSARRTKLKLSKD